MRRLLLMVLTLAAACGDTAKVPVAPLDQLYRPTGVAVHGGRLLVASSNSDLRYDFAEGGSVISVPAVPGAAGPVSGVRIPSFAGGLAVADAAACGLGSSLALVSIRGNDAIVALDVAADGALSCGSGCEVPLSGSFADPNAIVVACGGGKARAFVGYLRGVDSAAWVSAFDLSDRTVESGTVGVGPVRGMAYDALRERLWVTGVATSSPTPLRAIELAGGCSIARDLADGGCARRSIATTTLDRGLELHGIALSNVAPDLTPEQAQVRRVYLTARKYDLESAASAGGRTVDLGGYLVVADLVEGAAGVELRPVGEPIRIGEGAAAVAVLPARPERRDVVAAIATDSGELLIYDDETRGQRSFRTDSQTGAPFLGHLPWGMAIEHMDSDTARIFVASFGESFVTAIDVPLSAPMNAQLATRFGPGVSR